MRWTQEEDQILQNTSLAYEKIAKMIPHRSLKGIYARASKLGFKRDSSLRSQINSENQRNDSWDLHTDKEFCSIVDGELLGDGCIARKDIKNRNVCEYNFIAGSIHLDYAEYLHDLLSKKLGSKAKISKAVKSKTAFASQRNYYVVRFSNRVFESFYDRWYPKFSKKSVIPKDLIINPIVCKHWYWGDGSLDCRKKVNMFDLALHTEGFNHESLVWIQKQILKAVGIKFTIAKTKGYEKLRVHGDKARAFLKYIGRNNISSFDYKWADWKALT